MKKLKLTREDKRHIIGVAMLAVIFVWFDGFVDVVASGAVGLVLVIGYIAMATAAAVLVDVEDTEEVNQDGHKERP